MKSTLTYLFFVIILITSQPYLFSQVDIQERLSVFNDEANHDTIRARAVEDVAWEYSFINIDSAIYYAHKELEFVERIDDKIWTANAYNTLGVCYFDSGDLKSSLDYYLKGLKIYEAKNSLTDIAAAKNNIGSVYVKLTDFKEAEIQFLDAIKIALKLKNEKRLAEVYINYGILLRDLDRLEESISFYLKAKDLNSVKSNEYMMSYILLDLAATYDLLGKNNLSIPLYEEALILSKKLGDIQGVGSILNNLGIQNIKNGKYKKGIDFCLKSKEIGKNLNVLQHDFYVCLCLADGYEGLGDFKKSLAYTKLMEEYEDSILNENNIEEVTRLKMNFSFERKQLTDSLDNAKKDEIKDLEHATDMEKEAQSKLKLYGGLGVAVIVLIFLIFIVIQKQKDNKLILAKKQEVEQQKEVVELAHLELEEKNQEIMDSITYAKRIQSAILPPKKLVKQYLEESFILYKPKDIVAGDFYWMSTSQSVGSTREPNSDEKLNSIRATSTMASSLPERTEERILFAAADCTGHGVPGAMVSVVCNNALNRSVKEYGLTDPGEILNKTREIVIAEFEKSDEEVKDGMDIALVSLEFGATGSSKQATTSTTASFPSGRTEDGTTQNSCSLLKYAGAHNPLWIIRKGATEIEEIKANKQPIGKFIDPKPYTTHTVELNQGDTIYIFSDGYVDQFGGEKGKKFKAKAFRALLLSIQDKDMEEQRKILDETFETWRGSLEQIDDVCVIGVRI